MDLNSDDWRRLINLWILNEKHRYIMVRRMVDHIKYEELAEDRKVNLTDRQVKNIVKQCKGIIAKHI